MLILRMAPTLDYDRGSMVRGTFFTLNNLDKRVVKYFVILIYQIQQFSFIKQYETNQVDSQKTLRIAPQNPKTPQEKSVIGILWFLQCVQALSPS